MSTITEPGRTDQREDDDTSSGPETDADLSGIDETLRQAAEGPSNGDPVAESLDARMRLMTPRHAVWKTATAELPQAINQILKALGKVFDAEVQGLTGHHVVWTTGDDDWQPTGLYQVLWAGCPVHDGEYQVKVEAPGVAIEQDHLTADQVVELLKSTRVVR